MLNLVKRLIVRVIPNSWYMSINNLRKRVRKFSALEKNLQYLMWLRYESVANNLDQKTLLRLHEFSIYSQNGEDGILLYIFSKIGTTNCCFVEIGIDDGTECNTANLSINYGWHGLLVDSFEKNVADAKGYYQKMLGMKSSNVKIIQCLVTAENINKLLLDNGIEGEVDLLSIDIDGNDFWVWKAIDVIKPRVVAIEYNASLGSDRSLVIKYEPNFSGRKEHHEYYHGGSLAAMASLAHSKGYILIGCDSNGANAFFVHKDICHGKFHEVSVREAYYPHYGRSRRENTSDQFERVRHLDFVQI